MNNKIQNTKNFVKKLKKLFNIFYFINNKTFL